jgi:UV excision repair protein RAD23
MKLALRTLDGKNFIAEVEPDMVVADVKRAIDTQHGMDAARLKLIFQGKVLDDAVAIGTYNIGEGAFVVCMLVNINFTPFNY